MPKHSQQPPGVVQNRSALQCSKENTEQCGYDHAPVTRGRMRAQFPLPHGPPNRRPNSADFADLCADLWGFCDLAHSGPLVVSGAATSWASGIWGCGAFSVCCRVFYCCHRVWHRVPSDGLLRDSFGCELASGAAASPAACSAAASCSSMATGTKHRTLFEMLGYNTSHGVLMPSACMPQGD